MTDTSLHTYISVTYLILTILTSALEFIKVFLSIFNNCRINAKTTNAYICTYCSLRVNEN